MTLWGPPSFLLKFLSLTQPLRCNFQFYHTSQNKWAPPDLVPYSGNPRVFIAQGYSMEERHWG